MANYTNFGTGDYSIDGSKGVEARNKRFGKHYKVIASLSFSNISEQEIDLRESYAKSLVSNRCGIPLRQVYLELNSTTQTSTSLNEVYLIRNGKNSFGKVSVRVQRTFRGNDLYFVIQKKRRKMK